MHVRTGFSVIVRFVIQARQPGGKALDCVLVLGRQVNEIAHPLRKPLDADLLLAPACQQFLDPSIGEVHA